MSAVSPETKLCCRFLEDTEYWKLLDIFEDNNDEIPNPKLSRIAAVEVVETNEIVGFFCFQLFPHSEPLWIHPDYRNSGVWIKLVEMLLPLTEKKRTFMIASSPAVVEMCEKLGLKRISSPVYVKEV